MLNTDKPIWLPYPDYPFVEANQFGEIRTKDRVVIRSDGRKQFVKGHVLKQHLNRNGYLFVYFSMNGKQVNLLSHRVIATCFIPNPDNLPEVNHIDCDRTNNRLENLEWCTRQENIAYRDRLGHFVNNNPGRPVFAVDLDTGKVFWFKSQCEASLRLSVCQGDIWKVLKGKKNQAGGYLFVENEKEITEEKIQEVKDNMYFRGGVVAINPETSEVLWFKSQSEAAHQLGVWKQSIYKVLKGQYNTAGGLWFCNADENAVKKARTKFGDDIASKVEKLMNKHNMRN